MPRLGLLVLLLAAAPVRAQPASVPALTGRVVDRADLLAPATEAALDARLGAHEDSTSNQVAILTIPSLQGEVLEEYATRVFRVWALGQADRDNGVLLLVARDDREVRIEVGYGLEGDLTDTRSSEIIRNVLVPRFRDGDYEAGIVAGTEALLASVEGTYIPTDTPARLSGGGTLNGVPLDQTTLEDRLAFGLPFGGLPLLFLPFLVGFRLRKPAQVAGLVGVGLFLGLFVGIACGIVLQSTRAGVAGFLGMPLLLLILNQWVTVNPVAALGRRVMNHPRWGPEIRTYFAKQRAFAEARRRGDASVVFNGRSYRVPPRSSSGGSSSGGSSFGGGGGSSGGGGASGSW